MGAEKEFIDSQPALEQAPVALWAEFHQVATGVATLETLERFANLLKALAEHYCGTASGCRLFLENLMTYLDNDAMDAVFSMEIKKCVFLSYSLLPRAEQSFNDPVMMACKRLAEDLLEVRLAPQWRTFERRVKIDVYYFLSRYYRFEGMKQGSRDLTNPAILKGMNYLASSIAFAIHFECKQEKLFGWLYDFAVSLQNFLPKGSLHLQKRALYFVEKIQAGLDYLDEKEIPVEKRKIASVMLILAKLCLNSAVFQDKNSLQALYWFERAQAQGAVFTQKDQRIFDELSATSRDVIEAALRKLQALTHDQLTRHEAQPTKQAIFQQLSDILTTNDDHVTPLHRIMQFKRVIETADKKIISQHHQPLWRRFVENALSFIALLIPAIIRAYKSHQQYGTCRFWQPESQRAITCATKIIAQMARA